MTTSAARTSDRSRGFTLIEIVMVLAIATLLMGGAVALMFYSSDERILRDTSGEIEVLAKRARTISILQQTPYALEFRPGRVRLLPLAEAGNDEKTTALGRSIGGAAALDESKGAGRGPVREEMTVDSDIAVFIRRWNGSNWLPMSEQTTHIWRFDPDGLSEPVSIRLVVGESSAEDTYHPLTATISESFLEAR